MRFIIALLVNGLLVYGAAGLFQEVHVDSYLTAILVALLLALVNAIIKPILTWVTMPISIITLGLFLLVINGVLVLLVDLLVPGFRVDGLFTAIVFSVILTIFNFLIGGFNIQTRRYIP
ncbi:MAG: phage holin family protein [Saprospiraceae bacterium]